MAECAVFFDPLEVDRELAVLGLTVDDLTSALQAGHTTRVTRSPNDPPILPGLKTWGSVNVALRDVLLPTGKWRKDDPGNFSIVINDERGINVYPTSGDGFTGRRPPYPGPRTKSPKGMYAEAAIQVNVRQGDLFPDTIPEHILKKAQALEYPTWVLLYLISDDEIRAELSFPESFEDHDITSWSKRIILPRLTTDPGEIDGAQGDLGPDFDAEVRRKA